jgi:murein L,D-transpeptidase YcbB/YkuD
MSRHGRWIAIGLAVVVLVAIVAGLSYSRRIGLLGDKVTRQIAADLKARDMPDDAPWRDRRTQALLRAFYKKRGNKPAWTKGAGPNAQAKDLAEVLTHAEDEGLRAADYSTVPLLARLEKQQKTPLEKMKPKEIAEFDLLCSIAALHNISDVDDGRINPRALDAVWVAHPRKGDLNEVLAKALEKNRVKEELAQLPPAHEEYARLKNARARYAKIAREGGWPSIAPGPALKPGARGVRVRALRARLAASGDLASAGGDVYDDALAGAVRRYQERYGRTPDGIVAATELAELNVPAERRLGQIELNMERWRWLPRTFGDRHLLVNIPEYMLHLYEDGKPALDMRVVVGKAMNQTPVFTDTMTIVVVNPTWNVPQSIVQNEILPAVDEDPSYLDRHHMTMYERDGELAVRQDAGEDNALGALKFLFPNSFDVYLHDTPAGALFAQEERSFSHGCIRVADPVALASRVLRGRPESNPGKLRALIAAGETKELKLPKPLPVNIVYFTAFADGDGAASFREDVYGVDADLLDQLRGRARAQAASRAQAEARARRATKLARPGRRH